MPTRKLTNLFVERAKAPARGRLQYFDGAFPGLAFRITDKGGKSWSAFYRLNGRLRRYSIGPATGMARLNFPPHVVDKVLNHVSGTIRGVAAVYNRFAYLDERRAALTAWARDSAISWSRQTRTWWRCAHEVVAIFGKSTAPLDSILQSAGDPSCKDSWVEPRGRTYE
jgi:hypothetical protein